MQHLNPGFLLKGGLYEVAGFISSGGFGITYEARNTATGERVAIKEFFVSDFCNRLPGGEMSVAMEARKPLVEKLKKSFLREARLIRGISHPQIIRVTDYFEENATAYYVMDFIDGKSLGQLIKEKGPFPEEDAVAFIVEVAKALEYIHEKDIYHLDIKPGNIMADKNGNTILIDFGSSKQYDQAGGENTSLLPCRTDGYAPLEQYINSRVRFTPATDIYALGATLYKLLTGITPPAPADRASDENALRPLNKAFSPEVREAVEKAMALKAVDRYESVKDFLDTLTRTEEIPPKMMVTVEPKAEETEVNVIGAEEVTAEIFIQPPVMEYPNPAMAIPFPNPVPFMAVNKEEETPKNSHSLWWVWMLAICLVLGFGTTIAIKNQWFSRKTIPFLNANNPSAFTRPEQLDSLYAVNIQAEKQVLEEVKSGYNTSTGVIVIPFEKGKINFDNKRARSREIFSALAGHSDDYFIIHSYCSAEETSGATLIRARLDYVQHILVNDFGIPKDHVITVPKGLSNKPKVEIEMYSQPPMH